MTTCLGPSRPISKRRRDWTFDRPETGKIPSRSGGGVKQRPGMGLLRICQDSCCRALFGDATPLHGGDVVADLGCEPQVLKVETQAGRKIAFKFAD